MSTEAVMQLLLLVLLNVGPVLAYDYRFSTIADFLSSYSSFG